MTLTLTDLFCGAGGSSSGAEQIPCVQVRMAANHWQLAVDSHNANFPDADHDCADISGTDPRRYPTTDILWASPSCTSHSQAKGQKRNVQGDLFEPEPLPDESAERSRATMWDVPRFCEHHNYRGFVVENVVDAALWVMWDAWKLALTSLGYCLHVVYLNSMFAQQYGTRPAPQSRDRLYVVGHRQGRCPSLDLRVPAWCSRCECMVQARQSWKRLDRAPWGRYRAQYVYRCPDRACLAAVDPAYLPAAAAIDWTIGGQRIGDRDKPLKPATLRRIEAGLRRYAHPVAVPVEARTGQRARPVNEPARTMTGRLETGLACPPFLALLRSGRDRTIGTNEPLATVVADGSNHALTCPPFLALLRTNASTHRVEEPLNTVSAGGGHHGLVVPPLLVPAGGTWNEEAQPVSEPMRTRTTRETEGLAFPPDLDGAMVMRNNTARSDQGQMSTPVDEPLRTITTAGHQSLIRWDHLLVPYYRTGTATSVTRPVPTLTAVDRHAVVGPNVAVEDCTFRMLTPDEIANAMAFTSGYIVLGNKRERVRMYGNAVTPPAARVLIAALIEALTGEEVAA